MSTAWPDRTIPQNSPEARALIETARSMAPEIRERADEIEAARRVPDDIVKRLAAAGCFRMSVPRSAGGLEVDPLTNFAVVEELARADASVGWCVMIGSGTAWGLSGVATDELLGKIFAKPEAIVTGFNAVSGVARAVDGGYRLTGRWPFGSGIQHSDYLALSTLITDDGESLRMRPDGKHQWRTLVIPRTDLEVLDTWRTTGMRGTGSHDYTATDVFVPEERSLSLIDDPRRPNPMYRYPAFYLHNMGAVPLAVGAAAIEAMQRGKGPFRADKLMVAVQPNHMLRNVWLGEAAGMVAAARELAHASARSTWQLLADGGELTLQQRAMFRISMAHCFRAGSEAVLKMFDAFGSSAIYAVNPIDRYMRDVQTMKQHGAVAYRIYDRCGPMLLGEDLKQFEF